jgi:hypothetical protein
MLSDKITIFLKHVQHTTIRAFYHTGQILIIIFNHVSYHFILIFSIPKVFIFKGLTESWQKTKPARTFSYFWTFQIDCLLR